MHSLTTLSSKRNNGDTTGTASNSMRDLLQGILKTITRLPWLHTDAGGVFLFNSDEQRLELVTHVNFGLEIQSACQTVALGHCLCGRVAETGELLHVGCVDHRHDTHYIGMADHGHYVVPIHDGEALLGVLTLYVETGHRYRDDEANALRDFAAAMATVIHTHRMQRDKALADLILENSSHGIMIADREEHIRWVNRAFEQVTGYAADEVLGKTPRILASGAHGPDFYQTMWRKIEQTGCWQGEIRNRRKNGEIYPEFLNIVALKDENGRVQRYAGLFVDLTDIRQAEARIHQLAYFDPLTGLPNRNRFVEQLEPRLSQAKSDNRRVTVLLLDLDHFHEINNALGRDAGDALLRETARRLEAVLDGGLLARAELDQFLVAVTGNGDGSDEDANTSARVIAERMQAALKPDFALQGQVLVLESTVGVATCDNPDEDTVEKLLSRAALALQRAKRERRGRHVVFDEALGREADYDHHIVLNIRHAVERNELHLVYQPQVDYEGRLVGAEALLRWNSPGYGPIPPDRFIPHAEKRGVIGTIGHWVFEQAVEQLARWREEDGIGHDTFKLSVNLSPAQLIGQDVAQSFAWICENYGVPTSSLVIEITETVIMQACDAVQNRIVELVSAGFHIAIDDFGTGQSSLSRLHALPIDTFKIDRSFIRPIESRGKPLSIVKSMIAMAHELGQAVVAEGVENERQFAILRNLGCEYYQGYSFSRPVSAQELECFAVRRK